MTDTEQEILQKHLVEFLVKDVFNTISEDEILKTGEKGLWEHKGKVLTKEQVAMLKEQAATFSDSALWKILKAELCWHAQDKGFLKSQTVADQLSGKILVYLTQVIDKKLKAMLT